MTEIKVDNVECKDEECCNLLHLNLNEMKTLKEAIPNDIALANLSDLFKIFGDGTRIKILYTLGEMELCVCDLAYTLGMSDSAISHQLRVLKANRLVKSRREGKSMFYSLDDEHVKSILTQGFEHVNHI